MMRAAWNLAAYLAAAAIVIAPAALLAAYLYR